MKNKALAIAALLGAAFIASPAAAQAPDESPLTGVYACKVITVQSERLACYDAAVGLLETREAKKEFIAIDSAAAETLEREAFGFSLPSLPKLKLFSDKDGKKKGGVVELAVKSVSKNRRGITLTMENGQVWRGVSGRLTYIPKGDLTARISKGALGSFKLSLSNGNDRVRGLGVKRIE